jgi:hypothetical protein
MLSLYLLTSQHCRIRLIGVSDSHSPFIVDRLDDETQGWTDCVDVLVHDLFYYCRFSRVVQPTVTDLIHSRIKALEGMCLQQEDPHLLVLEPCLPKN